MFEIKALYKQYIAAILHQQFLAILLQRCGNTGFRMQISIARVRVGVLRQYFDFAKGAASIKLGKELR